VSSPDYRVPGKRAPQMIDYRCPVDGTTKADELRPQCPRCGTLMDPESGPDPYEDRRRRLRERRKK